MEVFLCEESIARIAELWKWFPDPDSGWVYWSFWTKQGFEPNKMLQNLGTNKGSPNLVDSDYEYEKEPEESINDSKEFTDRPSHLPPDHPGSYLVT